MNILAQPVVSSHGFLSLVIWLIIIGVVLWLLNLLIDRIPMDAQFKAVAKVILLVMGVLMLINALLGLVGRSFIVIW